MLAYLDIGTYNFVFLYDREAVRTGDDPAMPGKILAEAGFVAIFSRSPIGIATRWLDSMTSAFIQI